MNKITTPSGDISYSIVRSARRTMAITIGRDGSAAVRVPYGIPDERVRQFVLSRAGWIVKHTGRIAIRNAGEKKSYTDGEIHHFLGRPVRLKIEKTSRNRISFNEETIRIETRGPWNPELGEILINSLYKRLAPDIFRGRLSVLLEKHKHFGFRPSGLKVRSSISRWGSCSPNGSISLSTRLLTKRTELIDYVILHELCHLRHRNHGPNFYKLLQSVCPEYRDLQRELKSGAITEHQK